MRRDLAMTGIEKIDIRRVALIVLTCVVAHFFPYHLLLFSYAVLGPIHYLTQMSWLHDRDYYVRGRWLAPLFVVLTIFLLLYRSSDLTGILLGAALVTAAAVVIAEDWRWRAAIMISGLLLTLLLAHFGMIVFIAVMLPTLIHVFLFTAVFMWVSAAQERKSGKFLAFAALILGAASFFLPLDTAVAQSSAAREFFGSLVDHMQSVLQLSATYEAQLFGFLAFTFTYHYLYWLEKVEITNLRSVPKRRLIWIMIFYCVALIAYAVDYGVGFMLLALPSLLHVLLEFPLNVRSFFWLVRPHAAVESPPRE